VSFDPPLPRDLPPFTVPQNLVYSKSTEGGFDSVDLGRRDFLQITLPAGYKIESCEPLGLIEAAGDRIWSNGRHGV